MLADARLLLEAERLRSTVNRTYYAMYHAAKAVLDQMGIEVRSHGGVIARFGEHVVRRGLADRELARALHEAFDLREKTDYQLAIGTLASSSVASLVEKADEFIQRMRAILDKLRSP
jgi:uncharacterized protein (UPF0332 family)